MKFDENEIRKAISIMKPQNSLFEIRVIAAGGGNASGYFLSLIHISEPTRP